MLFLVWELQLNKNFVTGQLAYCHSLSKSDAVCFFKGCTSLVLGSEIQGTFIATKGETSIVLCQNIILYNTSIMIWPVLTKQYQLCFVEMDAGLVLYQHVH